MLGRGAEAEWSCRTAGRTATLSGTCSLPAGAPLILEKLTVVTTSRDPADVSADSLMDDADKQSYEDLLAEHTAVWEARWQKADVVIEGDPVSQQALRASIYHLLRAHVADNRVAIDAKGYAGDAYFGRYFWDTEMYLLPFYLYTDPACAQTLVEFRIQSLDGARANAARYGYTGARYAWESDDTGRDYCPNWQYGDHEVHVTADVVYGLLHYARAAGGEEFLSGPAASLLVETARYWLDRLDHRLGDAHPSLLGVMGPDEYTPICNNNAYTNRTVSLALQAAADVGDAGGATEAERERFAAAAASLPIPRREDGLVLQCEEFERLAEPRFEERWTDRSKPFAAHVSQEKLYRTKCLKQADVLLLMMLFPESFTDREVKQAWDYYLQYTTHDSSLSAGVHAIVAPRLGLDDEAWRFWNQSLTIDTDPEHGGAAEGIHIANAGILWQAAVFGFAGMASAMQSDVFTLRPHLPASWSGLQFRINWKGDVLAVEITRQHARITNEGNSTHKVRVFHEEQLIRPGETSMFVIDGVTAS